MKRAPAGTLRETLQQVANIFLHLVDILERKYSIIILVETLFITQVQTPIERKRWENQFEYFPRNWFPMSHAQWKTTQMMKFQLIRSQRQGAGPQALPLVITPFRNSFAAKCFETLLTAETINTDRFSRKNLRNPSPLMCFGAKYSQRFLEA